MSCHSICTWLLVGLAACGFEGQLPSETGEEPPADLPGNNPPPTTLRCKFTYVDLCERTPGGAMTIDADTTIDTSQDASCTHRLAQTSGPELCVVHVSALSLAAGVTLRGIGSRPLVLAATGPIMISGRVDVSSARAQPPTAPERLGAGALSAPCAAFARTAERDQGGGSGGAGGSFAGNGGSGGDGDSNNSLGGDGSALGGQPNPTIPASSLSFLRGGCRGQPGGDANGHAQGEAAGAGGPPGGALYVVTPDELTIAAGGSLLSGGGGGMGGGSQAGAGGGGSGGMIALEAKAIHHLGRLGAHGGGGGEGGVYVSPPTDDRIRGAHGDDAPATGTRADGGDSGPGRPNGKGGRGSDPAATSLAGEAGDSSPEGASGGGGSAGYLRLLGPVDGAGSTSPPAS